MQGEYKNNNETKDLKVKNISFESGMILFTIYL